MDCLKVAELLGEFFEKVTEGLVKLVATVAAAKPPVSGAAAVGVVPAQELRTHAAKMQHLMAQTLPSLTALVPQQSRGTRLEFARKLLVMRTPWLDSTSLKSHSDVRDVLADGSNDDKLEMVSTSSVIFGANSFDCPSKRGGGICDEADVDVDDAVACCCCLAMSVV